MIVLIQVIVMFVLPLMMGHLHLLTITIAIIVPVKELCNNYMIQIVSGNSTLGLEMETIQE